MKHCASNFLLFILLIIRVFRLKNLKKISNVQTFLVNNFVENFLSASVKPHKVWSTDIGLVEFLFETIQA